LPTPKRLEKVKVNPRPPQRRQAQKARTLDKPKSKGAAPKTFFPAKSVPPANFT